MITKRFRCLNWGKRFEAEVLEKGEAERERVSTGPVRCPECRRSDLREGWS